MSDDPRSSHPSTGGVMASRRCKSVYMDASGQQHLCDRELDERITKLGRYVRCPQCDGVPEGDK